MPAKPASRSKKTTPPAKSTKAKTPRRTPAPAPRRRAEPSWWSRLSGERRLDIIGVVLALVGLLVLLSLLSAQRSEITQTLVGWLYQLAGWGAFVLPVAFIVMGLWLVLRRVEKLPALSAARVTGLMLLFLNLLTWTHLLMGGGWELAQKGSGGGYLGAFFERLLNGGIGQAGTVIVLIAWLVVALALFFDISVTDLAHWLAQRAASIPRPAPKTAELPRPATTRLDTSDAQADLPPEFHLLPQRGNARPGKSGVPADAASEVVDISSSGNFTPPATGPDGNPLPPPTPAIAWTLPTSEAILDPAIEVTPSANQDEERAHLIEKTLSSFGAPSHVVEIHRGPTVTQFGVEPDFVENRTGRIRVRVSKIAALADDLALALAAPRIRIQAPVPGKNYVGIEVPNNEASRVTLSEVIASEAFQRLHSPLRFAIGKDVSGRPIAYDLASMPHLLIAGTTGSGKSVCVNAILCCFLMNNSPADLRLVLVDPKRVELTGYNGIPHLLAPVVVEAERVVGALQWMQREMDSRYRKFAHLGVRNIVEYNKKSTNDHLPYLVIVVDELADLMMLAPDETERSISRLAQLARATGIHLILATQRPSVDVVTGLIKANFPARIAFAVASNIDSRVILDQPGAERLLGRGDMLFQAPDAAAAVRLQGVFVGDSEIQRLVDYWRLAAMNLTASHPTQTVPGPDGTIGIPRGIPLKQNPLWDENAASQSDPLYNDAIDLVRREGRASITMLQRRMRIGYTRAARLVDSMEDKGIIGPVVPNSQVREILDYGPTAPPKED